MIMVFVMHSIVILLNKILCRDFHVFLIKNI
jgi:hypothetical protein